MLFQSRVGTVVVIAWPWLVLHDIKNIGHEGRGTMRVWLCLDASASVWLSGSACAIKQPNEQGGLTKVRVCVKMGNGSSLKVLHSTVLSDYASSTNGCLQVNLCAV